MGVSDARRNKVVTGAAEVHGSAVARALCLVSAYNDLCARQADLLTNRPRCDERATRESLQDVRAQCLTTSVCTQVPGQK